MIPISLASLLICLLSTVIDIAFASGIEFLVQLAARGEIDPKDVDIIYVTDRFRRAVTALAKKT